MRGTLLWSAIFGVSTALFAAPPASKVATPNTPKPPWQWTLEERIAARTDPAARRERIEQSLATRAAGKSAGRIATNSTSEEVPMADSIRGSDHPELFLPTELFAMFTRSAFITSDETSDAFRKAASERAASIGLPLDFIDRVEAESREFANLQRQERLLKERMARGEAPTRTLADQMKRVGREACIAEAASLGRLRARYGAEVDHFLYVAIAPGAFSDSFGTLTAEDLHNQEKGCQ